MKRLVISLILGLALSAAAATRAADMVRIPSGSYLPLYVGGEEDPACHVNAFDLDRYPVTHAQFLEFVEACPEWRRSRVPALFAGPGYLALWSGDLQLGPDSLELRNSPVTQISWFAARAYSEWRGKRLPTTAEWEYAAGAGNGHPDPGVSQRILDWYGHPTHLPLPSIGSTAADARGVWDLHGLVWEWVEDFNSALITGESRADGDVDRRFVWAGGAQQATDRNDYAAFMRYAFRSGLSGKDCVSSLGFRCARDPLSPTSADTK